MKNMKNLMAATALSSLVLISVPALADISSAQDHPSSANTPAMNDPAVAATDPSHTTPPQTDPAPTIPAATASDTGPSAVDKTSQDISDKAREAADKAKSAAEDVKSDAKKDASAATGVVEAEKDKMTASMNNVKASKIDDNSPVVLDKRMTASGILGMDVYNDNKEKVASVYDVILDRNGKASMIVLKEHSFLGLGGRLAAFNYDSIIDRKPDGDAVMPLTKEALGNMSEFTYKPASTAGLRSLPAGSFSVRQILQGKMVTPEGKKMGSIDNLSLDGGRAKLVIASYGMLPLAGDKVALDFDQTHLVHYKGDVNLRLSQDQTQKIRTLENSHK